MDTMQNEKFNNIKRYVLESQKDHQQALGTIATETLDKLNVTLQSLPQKCQKLINEVVARQITLGISNLEAITISQVSCANALQQLEDEYEILKLKQKNEQLQNRIDRNRKEINFLKQGLEEARNSLNNQNPNPDTIDNEIRVLKQKVDSYEENCQKAKTKFSKLDVPSCLHPQMLDQLVDQLLALREKEAQLKQKADDVTVLHSMRKDMHILGYK